MPSQHAGPSSITSGWVTHPPGGFWPRFRPGNFARLLAETGCEWWDDNVPRLGAALAFFSVFSAAPLLVITIALVGPFVGEETARAEIAAQTRSLVGDAGEAAIKDMLDHMQHSNGGILAGILGIAVLLMGAYAVFGELQASLNTIWKVPLRENQTVWMMIQDRVLSFLLVFGIGLLLLVSLAVNAGVSALGNVLNQWLSGSSVLLLQWGTWGLTLVIITLVFAFLFRHIPDVRIAWSDVLPGAVLTALLFSFGKSLLGLYLTWASVGSPYGAAGSLVVLLFWMYYSAQLFLFGAEFTQVYTRQYGTRRTG